MCTNHHKFTEEEVVQFREDLLQFYDKNKRDLPWRRLAKTLANPDQRGYSVWVSEIMLQQTQVATVVDYYNKWMKKWPTISALAGATLEEINEVWSGLGYYSRGRRLWQGTKKLMKNEGRMPQESKVLMNEIPGVGRYTASAVASIAFNEPCGVVDGNVIRVLTRMRVIGGEVSLPLVNDLIWELSNSLVDPQRPGDFNQALMELGATVCTPKSPRCAECPVSKICKAYAKVLQARKVSRTKFSETINIKGKAEPPLKDLEDIGNCKFCKQTDASWDSSLGVMNYPRKSKKKPPLAEEFNVVLLKSDAEYLLVQRPPTGLLAGLWEFPSILKQEETFKELFEKQFLLEIDPLFVTKVTHVFSHRHHTYHVHIATVNRPIDRTKCKDGRRLMWMNGETLLAAAISTSVRKIYKEVEENTRALDTNRKRKGTQSCIESMFQRAKKKKV